MKIKSIDAQLLNALQNYNYFCGNGVLLQENTSCFFMVWRMVDLIFFVPCTLVNFEKPHVFEI